MTGMPPVTGDIDVQQVDEHPYSVVFRSGELVAIAGRLGVSEPGVLVPGGFDAQCAQAFTNLDEALRSVGAARSHVVKVVAYMTDMTDCDRLNAMYQKFFAHPRPARSCIGVASLPYGGLVEIEALAWVHDAAPARESS